jgi:hypothetical protein
MILNSIGFEVKSIFVAGAQFLLNFDVMRLAVVADQVGKLDSGLRHGGKGGEVSKFKSRD